MLDRQEKMSRSDKTRSYPIFKEGDPVFVKNFAAGPAWFPASVIQITGPVSAKVQLDQSNVVWNRHFDHIRERHILKAPSIPENHPTVDQTSEPEPTIVEPNAPDLASHRYPQRSRKPPQRLYYKVKGGEDVPVPS